MRNGLYAERRYTGNTNDPSVGSFYIQLNLEVLMCSQEEERVYLQTEINEIVKAWRESGTTDDLDTFATQWIKDNAVRFAEKHNYH